MCGSLFRYINHSFVGLTQFLSFNFQYVHLCVCVCIRKLNGFWNVLNLRLLCGLYAFPCAKALNLNQQIQDDKICVGKNAISFPSYRQFSFSHGIVPCPIPLMHYRCYILLEKISHPTLQWWDFFQNDEQHALCSPPEVCPKYSMHFMVGNAGDLR